MSEPLHIACAACGATNRVPPARLSEEPRCGKCHEPLLDGSPVELTDQNFDKFVQHNDLPVVVDFWAEWCGPCKMMAPVFAQAAREQRTRLRFAKLDTDANPAIAQRYAIRSIPSLLMFKGGNEADRAVGALDPGRLRQWLSRRRKAGEALP
jgi:thioredoxin 2